MKAEEAAAGAEDTSDSRRTVTRANASHWIHQLPGKSKAGNIYPQTQPETPRVTGRRTTRVPTKTKLSIQFQIQFIFCCVVLYFQTLIVIIQWYFWLLHTEIWSSSSSSVWDERWRNRTNWDRLNPEELCQRLQDAQETSCKAPALVNVLDTRVKIL